MRRVRVLVVDDSALAREVLRRILESDPGIEVVATAADPLIAWAQIKAHSPDVITLDVEMPRMDGLRFLERLMTHAPQPVVMVSSERGCDTTLRALELGAFDFVAKPAVDSPRGLESLAAELVVKVKAAAAAGVRRRLTPAGSPRLRALGRATNRIVVIGASTGGTEALRAVLCALPEDAPGIAIVQHMPALFTAAFAARLDALAALRVYEARDGDRIVRGRALIAPGGRHLEVARSGAHYVVRVRDGEPVNRHRPSVDVLFESCAEAARRNAVGVILTGMGDDGARGLLAMRRAAAHTVAQDEASCVVFGMPKEAIACGAVAETLPLPQIAGAILRAA